MKTHLHAWRDIVALVIGTAALVGASLVLPSPASAESAALPHGHADACRSAATPTRTEPQE